MAARLVAVPDTDGELVHDLGRLEELLLQLQPYEPGDEPARPPAIDDASGVSASDASSPPSR